MVTSWSSLAMTRPRCSATATGGRCRSRGGGGCRCRCCRRGDHANLGSGGQGDRGEASARCRRLGNRRWRGGRRCRSRRCCRRRSRWRECRRRGRRRRDSRCLGDEGVGDAHRGDEAEHRRDAETRRGDSCAFGRVATSTPSRRATCRCRRHRLRCCERRRRQGAAGEERVEVSHRRQLPRTRRDRRRDRRRDPRSRSRHRRR